MEAPLVGVVPGRGRGRILLLAGDEIGLPRELCIDRGELARQADFIAVKQKEAAAVASRYDADKRRFRALKRSASDAPGSGEATRLSAADPAPGTAAHY